MQGANVGRFASWGRSRLFLVVDQDVAAARAVRARRRGGAAVRADLGARTLGSALGRHVAADQLRLALAEGLERLVRATEAVALDAGLLGVAGLAVDL